MVEFKIVSVKPGSGLRFCLKESEVGTDGRRLNCRGVAMCCWRQGAAGLANLQREITGWRGRTRGTACCLLPWPPWRPAEIQSRQDRQSELKRQHRWRSRTAGWKRIGGGRGGEGHRVWSYTTGEQRPGRWWWIGWMLVQSCSRLPLPCRSVCSFCLGQALLLSDTEREKGKRARKVERRAAAVASAVMDGPMRAREPNE